MPGGVGGGSREASPYPDQQILSFIESRDTKLPLCVPVLPSGPATFSVTCAGNWLIAVPDVAVDLPGTVRLAS